MTEVFSYLSVTSGIEAASLAWAPLGWRAVAFSEIAAFPSALLAHRYPKVPNHGDMTKFYDWPDHAIDLLVGGTPCQSFSVAGLRKGLADPRGNLMLTFGAVADRYRPRWVVWENVPGVLSSWSDETDQEGRPTGYERNDFDCFLDMLGNLGYGFAYRVLDAQFVRVDGFGRAVPQRRRRVFVVGCLGDWRSAAAVLLERQSLRGDPAPRRRKAEDVAGTIAGGARVRGGFSYDDIPQVAATLDASFARRQGCSGQDAKHRHSHLIAFGGNNTSGPIDVATALTACGSASGRMDFETETFLAQTGGGDVGGAIAFDCMASGMNGFAVGDVAGPLRVGTNGGGAGHQAVAIHGQGTNISVGGDVAGTLRCGSDRISSGAPAVQLGMRVRRLTPLECERLQGMPDGYTAIPWAGKVAEHCPDGHRYKALGNSMAVNVMRWLGTRISMVEQISARRFA